MVERTHFIAMDKFPRVKDHCVLFLMCVFFSLGFVKPHEFMKICPNEDMELSKLFLPLILIKSGNTYPGSCTQSHTQAHTEYSKPRKLMECQALLVP